MIIALDGPSASGKGTLARKLAAHFNLALLDTGALYRAVAAKLLDTGKSPDDAAAAIAVARGLTPSDTTHPKLRSEAVSEGASVVGANAGVRQALVDFQRGFARNPPGNVVGALLDGRDIGTVICPDADVKLFLTASHEARAERRFQQLRQTGATPIKARVLEDMKARDKRDQERATAPLKAAADALILDTTEMDADQVFAKVVAYIAKK